MLDSLFTAAFTGSKNIRFNPETRAGKGGNDAIAKKNAFKFDCQRGAWHTRHMEKFRRKFAATARVQRNKILSGE